MTINKVLCPDKRWRKFVYTQAGTTRGRVSMTRRGVSYTITGDVEQVGDYYIFKPDGKNKGVFKG